MKSIPVVLVFALSRADGCCLPSPLSHVSYELCVGESLSLKSCFPMNLPNRSHLQKPYRMPKRSNHTNSGINKAL